MARDIKPLLDCYPSIIAAMPDKCSSHVFIRTLMYQHQNPFIAALKTYEGLAKPFQYLHARLSMLLHTYKDQVAYVGHESSENVFGNETTCAVWQKVGLGQVNPLPTPPDDPDLLPDDSL